MNGSSTSVLLDCYYYYCFNRARLMSGKEVDVVFCFDYFCFLVYSFIYLFFFFFVNRSFCSKKYIFCVLIVVFLLPGHFILFFNTRVIIILRCFFISRQYLFDLFFIVAYVLNIIRCALLFKSFLFVTFGARRWFVPTWTAPRLPRRRRAVRLSSRSTRYIW